MSYVLFLGSDKCFQPIVDSLLLRKDNFIHFYTSTIPNSNNSSFVSYHHLYHTRCEVLSNYYSSANTYSLPSELLFDFLPQYESTFKSLCDRTSIIPLAYQQLNLLYIKLSSHIYRFLTGFQVTHLLFSSTPHFPIEYLFALISNYLSLNLRIIEPTLLGDSCLIRTSILSSNSPKDYIPNPVPIYDVNALQSSPSLKSSYSYNYVSSVHKSLLFRSFRVFVNTLLSHTSLSFSKSYFSNYYLAFLRIPFLALYHMVYLRILTKRHRSLALTELPSNQNYLVFFLHFQPERTTNPEGEVFDDQLKAIILLRNLLPPNVLLCIKEHPRQLELIPDLRKTYSRSSDFYDFISSLPGCCLVDQPSISLINSSNCLAVASVTGSAAWEALKLGKPAVVFGNTWFSSCTSVLNLHKHINTASPELLSRHCSKDTTTVLDSVAALETHLLPYLFYGASRDIFLRNHSPSDLATFYNALLH